MKTLFPIKKGGKYGYINESGGIVIEPRFDKANDFSEGLARVSVNGRYGYIDESGNIAIEARFNFVGNFSEGLASVWTSGKNGYIDRTGALVIAARFDGAGNFSEGLARVNIGRNAGFINRAGQMVFSPGLFNGIIKFAEGLAVAHVDNKWGYIDKTGKFVITPQFAHAGHFSEGLARVSNAHDVSGDEESKLGFIDTQGRVVIKCEFDDVNDFSEGLARVNVGGEFFSLGRPIQGGENFYIDKTGAMVIDANKCGVGERINLATSFSEGMARIELVEKVRAQEVKWRYGYIDKMGKVVIEPQFDDARDFEGGLAGVNIGYRPFNIPREVPVPGKWGYINRSGDYVWEPTD